MLSMLVATGLLLRLGDGGATDASASCQTVHGTFARARTVRFKHAPHFLLSLGRCFVLPLAALAGAFFLAAALGMVGCRHNSRPCAKADSSGGVSNCAWASADGCQQLQGRT